MLDPGPRGYPWWAVIDWQILATAAMLAVVVAVHGVVALGGWLLQRGASRSGRRSF